MSVISLIVIEENNLQYISVHLSYVSIKLRNVDVTAA